MSTQTYTVSTKDYIETIRATGYEMVGDWINFYAEPSRMVASFRAEHTIFIMQTPPNEQLLTTSEVTLDPDLAASKEAVRAQVAKWSTSHQVFGL